MTIKLIPTSLLAIIFLTAFSFAQRSAFEPESKLWVEGTSTIHDWTMTAENFAGAVDAAAAEDVKSVTVTVPVAALNSDNGTMNRKAHDALKAKSHPNVTYELDTAAIEEAMENGTFTLNTSGKLTMAGVTKSVTFAVQGEQLADGGTRYTGSTNILMSDFDIKPPKAMLGTLKTGNEVVVHFDVIVAQ